MRFVNQWMGIDIDPKGSGYFQYRYRIPAMHIYIYIYATPPETYRFWFLIVFYSVFCLFLPSKATHSFIDLKDFGCLSVMTSDASCCRYNDIFWWYLQHFRLPYWVPNKDFQFKHWQNAHALWPNVNFKLYIVFYNVFVPSCDTWILDFVHLRILQTYYLMINIVDMSLAFFPLLL